MLGCAVADELYARFPQLPEGKLTQLRASLVREEALAEVARQPRPRRTRLRAGTASPGLDPRRSLEAVIGAIFLDGGYAAARARGGAGLRPAARAPRPGKVEKDAKTRLQELLHARGKPLPEYRVVATHGAPHQRSFEVEMLAATSSSACAPAGAARSRQRAEQEQRRAAMLR